MPEATKPKYKVGMIGTGLKGTHHARSYALHPMTETVAVADPDLESLELSCRRFGVRGYSSYDEMFEKEQIDIAAPILTGMYNPDAVIASARAGLRAIFCDKPISASLEEADRMVEECRPRGIPWAAADAMRNFPQFWQAKEMIDAGEIGEVQSMHMYFTGGESGGEINGANCQELCVMRLFANDADVDWVVGWVAGDPFSDVDQGMGGYVRFVNGIERFLHFKHVSKRGIEVPPSGGAFYSDYESFHLWQLGEAENDRAPKFSELEEVEGLFPDSRLNEMPYDDEGWQFPGTRQMHSTQAIVDCLEKGVAPRCSGDDMRKGARDCHRSARVAPAGPRAGQTPSRRPEPQDSPAAVSLAEQERGVRQGALRRDDEDGKALRLHPPGGPRSM